MKKYSTLAVFLLISCTQLLCQTLPYTIVGTGVTDCYNNNSVITCPENPGDDFYGQDQGLMPSFQNNGNGTITDLNTGLMWAKDDSGEGLKWMNALAWVQTKNNENHLNYNDWRMPHTKELQSIVDYTRAPDITASAAIDPIFNCSTIIDEGDDTNYPFFWTNTTHLDNMGGVYVAFGEALGFMEQPPNSGNYNLLDVHGAGAQRSDPKNGDPDNYPYGLGPQGDVIRIYNYIRLVRDDETSTIEGNNIDKDNNTQIDIYPNPCSSEINISFSIETDKFARIYITNHLGQEIAEIQNNVLPPGKHTVNYSGQDLPDGIYFIIAQFENEIITRKFIKKGL